MKVIESLADAADSEHRPPGDAIERERSSRPAGEPRRQDERRTKATAVLPPDPKVSSRTAVGNGINVT
jgi:hypothetical protein